jgi:hypothetical protein
LAILFSGCLLRQGQTYDSFTIPRPLPREDCLVLGFVGGRARWDAENRWVRKVALALRNDGYRVETAENSKKGLALRLIVEAFDRDGDGAVDLAEANHTRLFIFGHSFGGAATLELARRLDGLHLPVQLTIQIDSVGSNDGLVPPNVRQAANLYQRGGWFIRGEAPIRAADPARTEILGDWRYDYSDSDIDLSGLAWFKRLFQTAHLRMGNDPAMWAVVRQLLSVQLRNSGCGAG